MDDLIEQGELRDSVRRVLDERIDRQALLKDPVSAPTLNRQLWTTMSELGWLGLAVPESQGGLGQPFSALAVLYREFGRALVSQQLMSAAIGLDIIADVSAPAVASDIVESAVAGDSIIISVTNGSQFLTTVSRDSGYILDGMVTGVLDAGSASHLLVPVGGDTAAIALISLPNDSVTISHRQTWDITRQVFDVKFDRLEIDESDVIHRGAAALAISNRMAAHFDLALAYDCLGGAEKVLDETLEYMQSRHQFNRSIASFQALKHRCANLKTGMEASRALVDSSCQIFSAFRDDWRTEAACARLFAGSVYKNVTEEAVQLHGGIGFTWEHSCHLFLKRAQLSDALGGSAERRKDNVSSAVFASANRDKF